MNILEYIVVGIIIIFSLMFLYKGLKEPIDWVVGLIKGWIGSMRDRAADRMDGGYEVINYG